MTVKNMTINHTEIVVNRQALLAVVRALDIGVDRNDVPKALDLLREPFFTDEITSGKARDDFTMNKYRD